ncbi:16S rRNA (cytidine(1402)-2'-O)-methyltransferase [Enterovirga rhinocerotis]|uniref:Ribosomal RNA small subunit methyltransferase I n=1 Tax=Enterovirga rhinocerotis TaxID=1339210 RepID=A0A4R7BWK9_9HYPH|nr:16S rRNA (cytidine(1402)-2'-O)-methyltransferase [Enterovirga rhinocerotis]TDR89961.1 16S rRNA (cytidine1402-2'-O)-methyltransferase [Enterovirga rhinocerotis]
MHRIDNRTRRSSAAASVEGGRAATFTAFGLAAEAQPIAPGLYLVATPIGNLGDVTLRALKTLAAANAVLAEDTRVTKTLLAHYGITTPLVAYHEHTGEAVRDRMIARLREGQSLALVSDAGTPLVSDPGYRLVEAAIAEGLPVIPIPGASAALAALVVAGLPTDRFFFEGFLPAKSGPRRSRLEALASIPGTLVLYEAPHRIAESLADAAAVLGPRPAAVARELTKLHETVRRGRLDELAARYAQEGAPKGEIVLLIAPATEEERQAEAEIGLDDKLKAALARHTVKDAAALVAGETGLPRRDIYARALSLARGGDETP